MVCTHVFLEKKKTTALFREQPNPRIAFADIGRTVDSGFIFIDVFDFERGVMYYHCFFCFLRTTSRRSRSFEFIFFCRETYSRDWQKSIFFVFFFCFPKCDGPSGTGDKRPLVAPTIKRRCVSFPANTVTLESTGRIRPIFETRKTHIFCVFFFCHPLVNEVRSDAFFERNDSSSLRNQRCVYPGRGQNFFSGCVFKNVLLRFTWNMY